MFAPEPKPKHHSHMFSVLNWKRCELEVLKRTGQQDSLELQEVQFSGAQKLLGRSQKDWYIGRNNYQYHLDVCYLRYMIEATSVGLLSVWGLRLLQGLEVANLGWRRLSLNKPQKLSSQAAPSTTQTIISVVT